ncbi:sugar ABC transporter permease, partial [Streptomyces sp. NPDC048669]
MAVHTSQSVAKAAGDDVVARGPRRGAGKPPPPTKLPRGQWT